MQCLPYSLFWPRRPGDRSRSGLRREKSCSWTPAGASPSATPSTRGKISGMAARISRTLRRPGMATEPRQQGSTTAAGGNWTSPMTGVSSFLLTNAAASATGIERWAGRFLKTAWDGTAGASPFRGLIWASAYSSSSTASSAIPSSGSTASISAPSRAATGVSAMILPITSITAATMPSPCGSTPQWKKAGSMKGQASTDTCGSPRSLPCTSSKTVHSLPLICAHMLRSLQPGPPLSMNQETKRSLISKNPSSIHPASLSRPVPGKA